MTLKTRPLFYYGFEVLPECNFVDIQEIIATIPGPEISFSLKVGVYCAEELREILETGLNTAGTLEYTVLFDRYDRRFTIFANGIFKILLGTGSNEAQAFLKCIGFSSAPIYGEGGVYGDPLLFYGDIDTGQSGSFKAKFPAGFIYEPQFKIQSFLDAENNQTLRSATVNESTDGENVEVIHFGIDELYEFEFKYITNLEMPCNGPIRNNPQGVELTNSFFKWGIQKRVIEYMPDEKNPNIFHKIRLEKLPGSRNATGYRLREMVNKKLPEFFETRVVTFRRLN